MTLHQFRELTKHLDGDLLLFCDGLDPEMVWHSDQTIGIELKWYSDFACGDCIALFGEPDDDDLDIDDLVERPAAAGAINH